MRTFPLAIILILVNPMVLIALIGSSGEFDMPASWW